MLQRFQLLDSALQLTDVGLEPVGDELCHVVRNVQVEKLCLAADDGDSGLEVRRGDVGDESPLKAVADPVFQCFQLSGRLVRGDDDGPRRAAC